MNRRRALGLVAAGAATPLAARAADAPPIRVATTPNDSGGQAYYAADMGFFREAGLNVEIATLNNGGAIASGVAAGAFEIAQASITSIASAHDKGLPFVVIAPAALWMSERLTSALIVKKDSPIKTGRDLDGKTVAVNGLFNITQVGAASWIDKNGGDAGTVKFVELPFAAMPAAIAAGRVDAAAIAQPELDVAVGPGGDARVLAKPYDSIAREFLVAGWFATKDFAKAHPDVVKKFAEVMFRTARWANKNPVLSGAILAKYTKVAVAPTMARTLYAEAPVTAFAQPLIDASARYKALRATFPAADMFLAP